MMENKKTTSVVTVDMIEAFAEKVGVSLEDGSQYPGIVGTLRTIENGDGTIQGALGELVQDEAHKELFAPLVKAHEEALAARGSEQAEGSESGEQAAEETQQGEEAAA